MQKRGKDNVQGKQGRNKTLLPSDDKRKHAQRVVTLFCTLGLIWVLVDQLTKFAFASNPALATGDTVLGLFSFQLVHNTGGAWGIFSGSTGSLSLFSIVICVLLLIYLFMRRFKASTLETCALALIFAGGWGNIIDRLVRGYVIDFINLDFMEFPVFNIADIGVTVGFVLLIVSIFVDGSHAATAVDERKRG